ncbi:hypothetical protein [Absidia glauca]|uniref:C2H2-type domain-containing protein n=1 Tax=Absidia glauca TaxID=4829 RepID=A0A168SG91_ABSGL|nr:hypothetical protein [Absidia glauca]
MSNKRIKAGNSNNNNLFNKRIKTGDFVINVYKLDAKKYQCGPCGKDFARKESLNRHYNSKKHMKIVGDCMDSPLDAISVDKEDTGANSDAVALEGKSRR